MNRDKVTNTCGSSDVAASAFDYTYARQLVQAYFAMLTIGCQRSGCTNAYCCSNPQTQALSATEAAIQSLYFAVKAPVSLCIEMDFEKQQLTESMKLSRPNHLNFLASAAQALKENNQVEDRYLSSMTENYQSSEELQPETSDILLTSQELDTTTTSTLERKSTPRQRLSIAVQLDNGFNKNCDLPRNKSLVISHVCVQPKNQSGIDVADPSISISQEDDISFDEQQNETKSTKVTSSVNELRKRLLSRPKEKLFDAIKRSFSRSKKAPLESV
ncbi:uncharacterized protein PHALS_14354 [Plasmopara halstedii]|uniref:Ubiquitin-protein ligase E3A N-terminal zinc-binding domain-containing protein n=1 Tax=Plasmopara halstedii TaxID=4781 RepID=A0A0P1AS89_PLAHL|nr:uncharacterized protein PHALS_14354 [Plasmopara halstedii]CEG44087.1 hypothetical protein PHALS_14354 [Plasmopara halstedii]|eukprot:XP_024580456.1 hypothetical protein PHALS_14354 [Plasmopara halstedii]